MFKKQIPSKNLPKVMGSTDITPYWDVIKQIIRDSDILLEILDARMPELSRNKELEETIIKNHKPFIFILNKADLISEGQLRKTYERLKKENLCFVLSSKDHMGTKRLREWLISQAKGKEKFKVGVLGYPNTGKSSVINTIAKRKGAKVSSKAGTTHGPQWINATNNLRIVDSPGVLPIIKEDEIRYAIIGSRNAEKIKNLELVATAIINLFEDKLPLKKFYGIETDSDDAYEIIHEIGKKKGFMKKGGQVEENRVSIQIIRDWQTGKLKL
ncbi:MAG: GTPase [Candidatus Pacearchaeota archaeon]|jgi:hypothetical protein